MPSSRSVAHTWAGVWSQNRSESSVAAEAVNVGNALALREALGRALGGKPLPVLVALAPEVERRLVVPRVFTARPDGVEGVEAQGLLAGAERVLVSGPVGGCSRVWVGARSGGRRQAEREECRHGKQGGDSSHRGSPS